MLRTISQLTPRRVAPIINTRCFSVASIIRNQAQQAGATPEGAAPKSSCPAGTVLNLKVFKKGDEPVAKEDSEYPDWLWDMLDQKKVMDTLQAQDFLKWRKKQLRRDNKEKIKNNNFMSKL
ncbi:54S ribosomal protein L37, mitochondrial [Candida viswanathii]|uniref:Large ribosomal subunit protein mL54 n=1 Tax=Candida viswanathii TaxID=5486 RepID=A0A367Y4A4_9ASCO|nr:54S ribosomal protein L37, mitochondrial [Candida viswanathii]